MYDTFEMALLSRGGVIDEYFESFISNYFGMLWAYSRYRLNFVLWLLTGQ